MSLSRANKPLASKTFDAIFARYVHREEAAAGGEGRGGRRERGWAERGEKIVRRGIGSANVQSTGGRFAFTRFEAIQFR